MSSEISTHIIILLHNNLIQFRLGVFQRAIIVTMTLINYTLEISYNHNHFIILLTSFIATHSVYSSFLLHVKLAKNGDLSVFYM